MYLHIHEEEKYPKYQKSFYLSHPSCPIFVFLKMQAFWLIPCVCRCSGSCKSRWIWRHWYQSDPAVHVTDCKSCMYVQGATDWPYIWKEKQNALYYCIRMMKITTAGVVECQGMLCMPEGGHVRCAGDWQDWCNLVIQLVKCSWYFVGLVNLFSERGEEWERIWQPNIWLHWEMHHCSRKIILSLGNTFIKGSLKQGTKEGEHGCWLHFFPPTSVVQTSSVFQHSKQQDTRGN